MSASEAMTDGYQRKSCKLHLGSKGWVDGVELLSSRSKSTVAQYFWGLPYAQPPVGGLRFRRTRPLPQGFQYGNKQSPKPFVEGCPVCPQPGWPGVLAEDFAPESEWSEDCLQLNVCVPSGEPPNEAGWPVLFYIHGGFLQFGNANKPAEVLARMYEETSFKAVVITPAYRVNALGFLASTELQSEADRDGETGGNMGFWDQRTALEWTVDTVHAFGGNPNNITIAGYSAGSHSVFHQLSHDLYLPPSQSIVRRAIMWSNGSGVQPRTVDEHQVSFDELLTALQIPLSLPASEKLNQIRQVPGKSIAHVIDQLKHSQFRACSEGQFVNEKLIDRINSGDYGKRMKERGIKLFIGECRDEKNLYQAWKTPGNTWKDLYDRLCEDYTERVVTKVMEIYAPGKQLPTGCGDWRTLFGPIYADLQVHLLLRGYIQKLFDVGLKAGEDVFRYHIAWRAECVDVAWPPEWLVAHATDDAIWWWGNGWETGLTDKEKKIVAPMHNAFARFVSGDEVQWEEKGRTRIKRLTPEGTMEFCEDTRWEEAQTMWKAVNGSREPNRVA